MRGKKSGHPASLWEVINKNRLRESQEKVINQIVHNKKQPDLKQVDEKKQADKPVSSRFFKKPGQMFEISLSYRAIAIIVLVVIVVLLLAFNLGQRNTAVEPTAGGDENVAAGIKDDAEEKATDDSDEDVQQGGLDGMPPFKTVKVEKTWLGVDKDDDSSSFADKKKDHVVVITVYQVKRDLEPVMLYFRKNGVETRIIKPASSKFYYLITRKKYESPERKGTDGYYALSNIKKVGAKYKAPRGYEPFGRTPFQDAYGANVFKSKLFNTL